MGDGVYHRILCRGTVAVRLHLTARELLTQLRIRTARRRRLVVPSSLGVAVQLLQRRRGWVAG
jgi:hypothetical protein